MKLTAQELAEHLACTREGADGLLRYLRDTGLALFRGERPSAGRRGKGAHVYEIVAGVGDALAVVGAKLEGGGQ
jgi:predicted ArsR family transcriptional regulator